VKFPRSKLAMAKADGVGEILRTRWNSDGLRFDHVKGFGSMGSKRPNAT
jgi:hypothetical protein